MQTETLLRRVQTGDADALDALVREYYPQILNYCRWHVPDAQQAQDAAQETFYKAVRWLDGCGGFAGQSEQAGNKINCISVRLTGKAMKTHIQLHARIFVIVKRADCHAMTADRNAVHLCRLSGGDFAFYCFKYIHCFFLSGNKKDT